MLVCGDNSPCGIVLEQHVEVRGAAAMMKQYNQRRHSMVRALVLLALIGAAWYAVTRIMAQPE